MELATRGSTLPVELKGARGACQQLNVLSSPLLKQKINCKKMKDKLLSPYYSVGVESRSVLHEDGR